MGLDDIKLSPFLVKKLYQNSLVTASFAQKSNAELPTSKNENDKTEIIAPAHQTKTNEGVKFLGRYAKNILILINENETVFLDDDTLAFLMNILTACNITMADVALVNCNDGSITSDKLQAQFLPEQILFFGTEPQKIGYPLQIPSYKIQAYNNQQFLCAPSLKEISNNKEEKKQLWTVLKTLFKI